MAEEIARRLSNINITVSKPARPLAVTTGGVGLVLNETIVTLQSVCPKIPAPTGSLYRTALAHMEAKVQIAQQSTFPTYNDNDMLFIPTRMHHEYLTEIKSNPLHLAPVSSIINVVGEVKVSDGHYMPMFEANAPTTSLRLSTLRNYVETISNPMTDIQTRSDAMDFNPIPQAVVQQLEDGSPVLQNPDDIMPANYTIDNLIQDFIVTRNYLNYVSRKLPHYCGKTQFEKPGTPAFLVSSELKNLRCCASINQLKHCDGRVDKFYSRCQISSAHFVQGLFALCGENHGAIPAQFTRDKIIATYFVNYSWRTAVFVMLG